ncbi:MAG: hypothetical protein DWQ19_09535 [Crenarchaeota archaeon]|nr:MAG: hypothetical protein DWQ19_09535 [Thermoproteota archaeon]
MNEQEWIKEAKLMIKSNQELIEEVNNLSSCEAHWHEMKRQQNWAYKMIAFLKSGISLIEEKEPK